MEAMYERRRLSKQKKEMFGLWCTELYRLSIANKVGLRLTAACLHDFSAGLHAGSNYCQSHVLVDTWMLTVKLVYKLSDVPGDLKWATNTHMTPFTLTFKA